MARQGKHKFTYGGKGEKKLGYKTAQKNERKKGNGRMQNIGDEATRSTQHSPAICRITETIPLILKTPAAKNYALIDSGNARKLERYGPYVIDRPEAQALWQKELDEKTWRKADAIFSGEADEEGMGRWHFPNVPLGETWPLSWQAWESDQSERPDAKHFIDRRLDFFGRFTSFRHVGVFPEQAAHWQFIEEQIIKRSVSQPGNFNLLNLFGYSGIASLVAARAGAHVTHVDASKKAIGWARENQQLANLNDKPIRWICDDAVKFCERETRRQNHYDAIILDPPKFGRGPKGETWQLFENLPHMVHLCRKLLSHKPAFVILTSYSIRSSFYAMHELMQEVFGDCGGQLQSGELIINTENSKRALSTSLFSRWVS